MFYSVVLMEPNLDDPGFVSPWDPGPSSRTPLPPSGSSSSLEGAVEVRRTCLRCHRRMNRRRLTVTLFVLFAAGLIVTWRTVARSVLIGLRVTC